ncbi:MAG: hypothetical protein LBT93_06320 [Treponema sp.]|jgi:hypothetical protein|nr:hypothetical protein [Treponema sp.]
MKRYRLVIFISLIAVRAFAQSGELALYTDLYNGVNTVSEQFRILQEVRDAKISGVGEFYTAALDRLLREYPNVRSLSERNAADEAARLLAGVLGDEKITAAEGNLWKVVETFSNPLIKADALLALGRIGAVAYIPQVVQLLSDLNARPPADRESQIQNERIAYGAILALENFKDPAGYLPVFFASAGWYSDRVKNQASISLPLILDDPSEQLNSVIHGSAYSYELKHLALRTAERSNLPNESKGALAVSAYSEGWRGSTNDMRLRGELTTMRKLAISMIRRYGTEDTAVYPLLDRSYKTPFDMQEKLDAIAALSALASEDAAKLLANYLLEIHNKRQSNILTSEDEQVVRVLLPALGATKRASIGRAVLSLVQQSPAWTNAVRNVAAEALRNIQ